MNDLQAIPDVVTDAQSATITLPASCWRNLREGMHCWWNDNLGREILVHMCGPRPGGVHGDVFVVELTPADLDVIGSSGGLAVMDITGGNAWTIGVAA